MSCRTYSPWGPSRLRALFSSAKAMTTGQLAAATGLSDRTVRRVRARMNGAATT